jgi:hypothetical protein
VAEEPCKHDRYTATSKMVNVKMPELDTWQLILKITVFCARCQKQFTFRAHHGFSTREPTVSSDSFELRVPIDFPGKEEGIVPLVPPTGVIH